MHIPGVGIVKPTLSIEITEEPEPQDINYKEKYFKLIRLLKSMTTQMDNRCPLVRSCCGGCNLLSTKINKIKKETLDNQETWE